MSARALERIEHCKNLIYEYYYNSSIIDKIVQTRDADVSDENFLKMYKRIYIPKEWFTREDVYPDLVFEQIGSGIAFSEKKYIIGEILRNEEIERSTVETIDFNTLKETSFSFSQNGIRPTVMFAPIEFFTKLHIDWREAPDLQINTFDDITILENAREHTYKIFWSNKFMPFDEFIFIDRSFGEWVSKPSFNERLSVIISESDRADQLDLLIYTTLKFRILDTNRIAILQIARQEP